MKFTEQELRVIYAALCLTEKIIAESNVQAHPMYGIVGAKDKKGFLKFLKKIKKKF